MRQIRDMSILEIDITNVCNKRCSNCTRFCGHHQKPFFMDFETFKRAVDSLEGYEGLISTIGGEPLLHPEYEKFADYLQKTRGGSKFFDDGFCKAMVKNYLAYAKSQRWFEGAMNKGKGYLLFTSMPKNYYDHYETLQDTITDLWLNDHTNPSFHQPILVSRKDLGISDEEFEKLRNNCWLQNFWSASITPKGVFFCEIAGTLDLLFNGPGGIAIEPGWWDRDIKDFEEQFRWCELCGMALTTYSRNANDETDDASPSLYRKLKAIKSPKLKQNKVFLFDPNNANMKDGVSIGDDMGSVGANYQPDNDKRLENAADNLKPQKIYMMISAYDDQGWLKTIDRHRIAIKHFSIVTSQDNLDKINREISIKELETIIINTEFDRLSLGGGVNRVLQKINRQEWIMISDNKVKLPDDFSEMIKERYLNPGYLFVFTYGNGKVILFSKQALAVRKLGFDGMKNCLTIDDIINKWNEKKCYLKEGFENKPDMDVPYFRNKIFENYLSDLPFINDIKMKLESQKIKNKNILILQSAFVYHTLGIIKILQSLGYNTYVLSSSKFKDYFSDWLPSEWVFYFDDGAFEYESQKMMREKLKIQFDFAGAIVPFSFGPSTVKPIDDYSDAIKTAEDIGGRLLGIINIRRKFIELEYDLWESNC